jgi:alpha-D-xyloside xylohydrolase
MLSLRSRSALCFFVLALAVAVNGQSPVTDTHADGSGVLVQTGTGKIKIEACGDRVIHVVASPSATIPPAKVPVVKEACNGNSLRVISAKGEIKVRTNAVELRINPTTAAISYWTTSGQLLLAEPNRGGKHFDVQSPSDNAVWQIQQTFNSPPDEALYGLGQHQEGIFNVRGVPIRLHQANTNISVPVLLSSRGYGLLWNNPSLTDFNPADQVIAVDPKSGKGTFKTGGKGTYGFRLASDNRDQLIVRVNDHAAIDITNMWTPTAGSGVLDLEAGKEYEVVAAAGPGGMRLSVRPPEDSTIFRSELGDAIDYYFFYGPELNNVISEYRRITGEAPLFPKWAYGYLQCRERYHSEQEILDIGAEFRKRKIPVDALIQDWQYWGKYGWNAAKFDETYYPHPKEMMTKLHAEDIHMLISVWSRFGEESDVYKRMQERSFLIKGEPWIDIFNPDAEKAFWSELNAGIFQTGMDGWWMDASEPEFDILKGKQTFLGSGNSVRNAYPLYVTKTIYEGQRATTDQKRVIILTRSAFAGQQRNGAASWSGDISSDWITFQRQIPAGLSFSMSGLPYWTTDIGGFFRPDDQYTSPAFHELLVRWFQYGSFCPLFRVHGYKSNAEIWNYGADVERILRRYDELRYRLLPYIYTSAWGVTKNGETLMRALPLEFSADPKVTGIPDQFMFGNSLLINPVVTEGARERSLYLPAGHEWFDFWSGNRLSGGRLITAQAPLDTLPIFAKSGSIVPFGPAVESAAGKPDPIELRIYGGADADFTLYEDEGDSYNYEKGAHATIPMHWDDKNHTLKIGQRVGTFRGILERRTFNIVIVRAGRGNGLEVAPQPDGSIVYDGKPASAKIKLQGLTAGSPGT